MPPDNHPGLTVAVHVRFHGFLADYAAVRTVDLEVPAQTTLAEFLDILRERFPNAFLRQGMDPRAADSTVKVFWNNELATVESGGEKLKPGDELRFFPAISGG